MRIKIIMLTVFVVILTLGAVSAADDNVTSDSTVGAVDDELSNDLEVVEGLSVDSSINNESDEVLGDGVFSDISALVSAASPGSVVQLDEDFSYDDFSSGGVPISKSITIDGKGHTLDAKGKSRFFKVQADNIVLKNIVFKNGVSGEGSAIHLKYHDGCVVENCSFVNCSDNAIYVYGSYCSVIGCSFVNCGNDAIYVQDGHGSEDNIGCSVVDCSFIGSSSAINVHVNDNKNATNCSVAGCSFVNCSSVALQFSTEDECGPINANVVDCSFLNCEGSDGGAIHLNGAINCVVDNCNFIGCTASDGGAIYVGNSNFDSINCTVVGCSFMSCSASSNAGAIYVGWRWMDSGYINCSVVDSSFMGCSASDGGAIYFNENCCGVINNCSFVGCSASDGGAVYVGDNTVVRLITSNFENNFAKGSGAAIFGDKSFVFDCTFRKNTSPESDLTNNPKEMIPNELSPKDNGGVVIVEFPLDAEGTVEVYVNGTFVDVVRIVNGIAEIDLSKLKGVYVVSFVYSGDANYPSFEKESTYITTVIAAKNINVVYLSGKTFSISVYEFGSTPAIKNTKVVIKVNNKAFKTLKTKDRGIVKFKITQVPGKYKLSISSLNATVTKTLTVKHLVTLKTVNVKKSAKKLTLQASLAKINGKYLKNKKITFKFKGKKYAAKTNKKGVAKVTIKKSVLKKLKVGKKITYQATYSKDTVKKTVKVKK